VPPSLSPPGAPGQVHAGPEFAATGEPCGVFIDNNLGSDQRYLRRLATV
jgi:hypothetical protein